MRNLKLMFTAALVAFAFSAMHAQEPVNRVKKPQKTTEQKATELTDTLNSVVQLTSDQYPKAYASNFKFISKREDIKRNAADAQTSKQQIMAAVKARKMEMATILTPQQVAKWQAWKHERKGQMMKDHPGGKEKNLQEGDAPVILDDMDGM
jgi:hypothetical protein